MDPDPEEVGFETKSEVSRVKLNGQNQIIVARIGELLRRMPS
jgi:hypothetical protein